MASKFNGSTTQSGHVADSFVRQVEGLHFPNAFNPYAEFCKLHDKRNGAELRRQNLRNVFQAALTGGIDSIWIARDLGYRGGRRTGLALTDELHLQPYSEMLKTEPLQRATNGPPVQERTALTIWRVLQSLGRPIFLWNVFPLHPHEPDDQLTNRAHTREEAETCRPLLLWVLQRLNPKKIVAIGRDAQLALAKLDVDCNSVRHPSYGGHNEFISGLSKLYGIHLSQIKPHQPTLF